MSRKAVSVHTFTPYVRIVWIQLDKGSRADWTHARPRRESKESYTMHEFDHPRVVVGIDGSLSGLAAIRSAVAEARRRELPLLAVRSRTSGIARIDTGAMTTAFLDALGTIPRDINIELRVSMLRIEDALCTAAADPRDLIVVGTSGKGLWHAFWAGSVLHSVTRRARCPVLAVPAPEMSRVVRGPRRWRGLGQWDPLRDLKAQQPELQSRPYSDI